MTGYSDTTAGSAAGQNFSFGLPDGSTLSFNLKRTYASGATGQLAAKAPPLIPSAVIGNAAGGAYSGIPGLPFIHGAKGGYTLALTGIQVVDSKSTAMPFTLFATDTETTGLCVTCSATSAFTPETLQFTTNGGAWQQLELLNATNGAAPSETLAGIGSPTVNWTGTANQNNGSLVISTASPSSLTLTATAGTLTGTSAQAFGFGLVMASVSLSKSLGGTRVNDADQFDLGAAYSADAAPLAAATTTGTAATVANGTVSATVLPGAALTLSEAMAAGSASPFTSYLPSLSCSNARSGSTTSLPSGPGLPAPNGTSYSLTPAAGDLIVCGLTNTANPPPANITLAKSGPATASAGGSLAYTIGLGNSGQTASGTTLTVKDALPAGVTADSVVPGANVASVACGMLPSAAGAELNCTVTLASPLAAGAANGAAAFTVNAKAPGAAGSITNYASTDPAGGTNPPAPGAACAPATSCGSATTQVDAPPGSGTPPQQPAPVPVDARWMLVLLGALLALASRPAWHKVG
ncbi:hypothetical protein GCM10027082_46300 [Comamonas humi]